TQEYTKGEAERLPEPETGLEEAVIEGVEKSEELEDSPVVEAFDEALTSVQEAAEELEPERDPEVITDFRRPMMEAAAADAVHAVPHDEHAALLSDTTEVFGNVVTVPGGIYTVVFGFLAVATVVEVL